MQEVIEQLESIELDLREVSRKLISLKRQNEAIRVSEINEEIYGIIMDIEDELWPSWR